MGQKKHGNYYAIQFQAIGRQRETTVNKTYRSIGLADWLNEEPELGQEIACSRGIASPIIWQGAGLNFGELQHVLVRQLERYVFFIEEFDKPAAVVSEVKTKWH